ncbi:DUF3574 domain-containing protein [Falsiroseomonas oryziterrae]|uniref:DUF3574 domain-containing protein n=1 Tax=Falsiroseomonas oryziterrae TaxID=2911368 RepID=UPI001F27A7C1|nr:DUF3574 domain-containing protein [Roseomonas sp. NPKOSM-4]
MRRTGSALLLLLLGACAAAPPACPPGLQQSTVLEAFFGRSSAGREVVGDADWARFMDEVVTPAFPDGLSVLDAAGQWRGRDGRIARERSKLLVVALPGGTPTQAMERLAPVAAAYRARFAQESVMVATRQGCVGF